MVGMTDIASTTARLVTITTVGLEQVTGDGNARMNPDRVCYCCASLDAGVRRVHAGRAAEGVEFKGCRFVHATGGSTAMTEHKRNRESADAASRPLTDAEASAIVGGAGTPPPPETADGAGPPPQPEPNDPGSPNPPN